MDRPEWSASESRRNNVPHIPNEIYLEIVGQLHAGRRSMLDAQYRSTLSNLSLVCHFFRAICLPFLFESLNDTGGYIYHPDSPFAAWRQRILRKDSKSLEYTRYVKTYTIGTSTKNHPWLRICEPHFTKSVAAMSSFVNLHTLSIRYIYTDAPVLHSISHLQQLRSVAIEFCASPSQIETMGESKTIPPWTSLTVNGSIADEDLAVIRLLGHSEVLREFRTNDRQCFEAYTKEATVRNLQTLELGSDFLEEQEQFHALWKFLEAYTPALEQLVLRRKHHYLPHHDCSLSSSSLPRLKTLHCPLELIPHLTRGRTLQSVSIELEHFLFQTKSIDKTSALWHLFRDVKLLNLPITSLHTPAWLCDIVPFSTYFPNLQDLTVRARTESFSRLRDFCREWSGKFQVRSLAFTTLQGPGSSWSLRWQYRQILEIVSPAFPSAERLALNEFIEWHRRHESCLPQWVAVIMEPNEVKAYLEIMFEQQDSVLRETVDVNGCYTSLFSAEELDKLDQFARNALGLPALGDKVQITQVPARDCE